MSEQVKTPFVVTRHSNFIDSMADAELGPVSSPDDRIVRHTLRQETITATVPTPTTGVGLFVVYPLTTNFKRIFHYVCTDVNTNAWALQDVITQAQDLKDNYNYARVTASKLEVRASTQSTTAAVLSGNFNAVYYEAGGLSEVGLNTYTSPEALYSGILATTTNHLDKAGSVYTAEGVMVIGLPSDASTPYSRLDDATPFTNGNTILTNTQIVDSSMSLQYLTFSAGNVALTNSYSTAFTFNCDIGLSPADVLVQWVQGNALTYAVVFDLLNCFGSTVFSTTNVCGAINPNPNGDTGIASGNCVLPGQNEPICAVRVRCRMIGAANGTMLNLQVNLAVLKGKLQGEVSPMAVVVYSGVAEDVSITLKGMVNYELVPNPNLLKQMKTYYGPYDPQEFDYLKTILSYREELQIKSIMPAKEYSGFKRRLQALADVDAPVAEAGGMGTLIKGMKAMAIPMMSSLLGLPARAAGGRAYAAGGRAYASPHNNFRGTMPLPAPPERSASGRTLYSTYDDVSGPLGYSLEVPSESATKACLFPTIVANGQEVIGGLMYAAVSGNHSGLVEECTYIPDKFNRFRVYGKGLPRERRLDFELDQDYTLVPLSVLNIYDISSMQGAKLEIPTEAPGFEGTSWMGAVGTLVENASLRGMFPMAVTGSTTVVKKELMLSPNPAYYMKQEYCQAVGYPLYGAMSGRPMKLPTPFGRPAFDGKIGSYPYPYGSIAEAATGLAAVANMAEAIERYGTNNPFLDEIVEYDGTAGDPAPLLDFTVDAGDDSVGDLPDFTPKDGSMPKATRRGGPGGRLADSIYGPPGGTPEGVFSRTPPSVTPRARGRVDPFTSSDAFKEILAAKGKLHSKKDYFASVQDLEMARELPPGTGDVMNWIINTGLMPTMTKMMQVDRDGNLTHRTLRNYYEVTSSGDGRMNQAGAKWERSVRKAQSLASTYRGITPEWVFANDARGPDEGQAQYFRNNGELPPAGDANYQASLYARPSTQSEAVLAANTAAKRTVGDKIENIMKSDLYSTDWLRNELQSYVAANGKIPPSEVLVDMKARDPERAAKKNAVKQPGVNPVRPVSNAPAFMGGAVKPQVSGRASRFLGYSKTDAP